MQYSFTSLNDPLAKAAAAILNEGKAPKSKALEAIAKLSKGFYPKKDAVADVYKSFPIEAEIIDNGDGTFSHPEISGKMTRAQVIKTVGMVRKASLE